MIAKYPDRDSQQRVGLCTHVRPPKILQAGYPARLAVELRMGAIANLDEGSDFPKLV